MKVMLFFAFVKCSYTLNCQKRNIALPLTFLIHRFTQEPLNSCSYVIILRKDTTIFTLPNMFQRYKRHP